MLGWLAVLFPDRQFDAAVAYLRRFADEYVKVALETWSPDASKDDDTNKAKDKADRYVFLHEMFRSWADRPARIRSEQLALMAGGRDTTATALTNCVHLLARAPDVWAKVRAECLALDVDQGGETTTIPTYEQLRTRLTYLSSVVRESLRLRPPVTDVTRTSLVDTVLPRGGGKDGMSPVFVAKGTNLRLWPYVVQRRRDLWGDDAHEFRPERWSDGSGAPGFADQAGGLRPGFAYVPFGGGPRIW